MRLIPRLPQIGLITSYGRTKVRIVELLDSALKRTAPDMNVTTEAQAENEREEAGNRPDNTTGYRDEAALKYRTKAGQSMVMLCCVMIIGSLWAAWTHSLATMIVVLIMPFMVLPFAIRYWLTGKRYDRQGRSAGD